jgi:hypothetical protein
VKWVVEEITVAISVAVAMTEAATAEEVETSTAVAADKVVAALVVRVVAVQADKVAVDNRPLVEINQNCKDRVLVKGLTTNYKPQTINKLCYSRKEQSTGKCRKAA